MFFMRSKKEIKNRIKEFKEEYKKSTNEFQKIVIANKIEELKWIIKDYSDQSWMFEN